jgi:phenylalanyl-tRNA synthetase beta chain
MKFSESWLRTFVDPALSSADLCERLTMAGLEVEGAAPAAPAFSGVVVAKILSAQKHPNADRLQVCEVDAGEGHPRQIVCGAPNARAGILVPCALPGALLPGGFKIKATKMRGAESAGMLCSARELGISEDHGGLLELLADAPIGEDIRKHLDLDDTVIEIKLTPNRADCLSLVGIAREVAALTDEKPQFPAIAPAPVESAKAREVVLDAPRACPRYCGRVVEGVDARAATPDWMKKRLQRSGIRSISALVDITNYVLLEQGQPLHAFDDDKLKGAIHVRMAAPDERLLLLNGQDAALPPDVLVVADGEKTLAMAGIMGGEGSGISLETQNVFLESAFFSPRAVAGRARRYNFSSDASHRYERGVDFARCREALERATALVLSICGGKAGKIVEAASEADLPARKPVRLRPKRLAKVLGMPFREAEITSFLSRLHLPFTRESTDFWVSPPSFRFDLEIEEDLIEEIARLYGYDRLPAPAPKGRMLMLPDPEGARTPAKLREKLAGRGYQEIISFSFVPPAWEADFAGNEKPVALANPIASQLSVMRTSLIGGLIEALKVNLNRREARVRLFENGRCFLRAEASDAAQPWRLSGLAYGPALPEGWDGGKRRVDFFDVKGDLEALFAPRALSFERLEHPALHPGRAANVLCGGKSMGFIGELHPKWVQKYELPFAPVVFEIERQEALAQPVPAYCPVSKFPPALRDLAIVAKKETPLDEILAVMEKAAPAIVSDIRLFDLYQGKGIAPEEKSLAFRVLMQDTESTLTDAQMDAAVEKILAGLEKELAIRLRA